MRKVLVTGSLGQIGTELTLALRDKLGTNNVIATDIRMPTEPAMRDGGPFEFMDCTDHNHITRVMQMHAGIDTVYHLAALLSAVAEAKPTSAWTINMHGLYNMLEAARQYKCQLFFPSSIGAFGKSTPKMNTPQVTIQRPDTMYGVTKVAGELLCDYYHKKFHLDTRGLRFPGLISHQTEPGGGTTDYAVEIFYEAIKHKRYTCYLREDTCLDMMYMPDALRALLMVMEADGSKLVNRNAYNVTAVTFTPKQIADAIRKHVPEFTIDYNVDPVRQGIADSWPDHMDDSAARAEWGWKPEYDMAAMTKDMISRISEKIKKPAEQHTR